MKQVEYSKMYDLEDKHFWFVGKRIYVHKILGRFLDNNKDLEILDVGCGTGALTKSFESYGNVTGLDLHDSAIEFSRRRGLNVVKGEVEKIPFEDEFYDLVIVVDVLYHKNVRSLKRAINELYRVTKHGGLLLISDSAFEILGGGHDWVFGGKRRFREFQLRRLISSKYKVLRTGYIFPLFFVALLIRRLILRLFGRKVSDVSPVNYIVNNIILVYLRFEIWLSDYISYKIGSSVYGVARKK